MIAWGSKNKRLNSFQNGGLTAVANPVIVCPSYSASSCPLFCGLTQEKHSIISYEATLPLSLAHFEQTVHAEGMEHHVVTRKEHFKM